MANTKISALTDLASTPASTDRIPIVDVSDTTMGASGTTKYVTAARFVKCSLAGALQGNLNVNTFALTNVGSITAGTATITTEMTDGSGWQNVSFNTGWDNFGGVTQTAQYKKVGDLVFLRGLVKRSSGVATTIFTLPSGYRPLLYLHISTASNGAYGQITIDGGGIVSISVGSATDWISLNNIAFSVI